MKGIFEDFIGIWDNNVDENICKELIKYYDWTIENNYNISPNIDGNNKIKLVDREDEAIFMNSASMQYPESLCEQYWKCLQQCIEEYMTKYSVKVAGELHSWMFKVHKVKEKQGYHSWHCENSSY